MLYGPGITAMPLTPEGGCLSILLCCLFKGLSAHLEGNIPLAPVLTPICSLNKLAELCGVTGSTDMKQDKLAVVRAAVHTICNLRASNAQLQQALAVIGKVRH